MATSEAQVCNKALARIGIKAGAFIQDLATDTSEEAEVCNLFYADERDSLLMEAPWPFAIRRVALPEVDYAVEPARDGWEKIFRAPNDLIEPLYIWTGGLTISPLTPQTPLPLEAPYPLQAVWQNPRAPRADQRVPFAIEASSVDDSTIILCDFASPKMIYISRISDPTRFSPLFTDALVWHLASVICMPLAIKPEVQELCEKRAEEATERAVARHFQGQQEDISPDSEMIIARL